MVEILEGTSGELSPNILLKGQWEQVVCVCLSFEYLQGWRLCNICGQHTPIVFWEELENIYEIAYISVCIHCLLPFPWAALRRVLFHLLYFFCQVFICTDTKCTLCVVYTRSSSVQSPSDLKGKQFQHFQLIVQQLPMGCLLQPLICVCQVETLLESSQYGPTLGKWLCNKGIPKFLHEINKNISLKVALKYQENDVEKLSII